MSHKFACGPPYKPLFDIDALLRNAALVLQLKVKSLLHARFFLQNNACALGGQLESVCHFVVGILEYSMFI